MVLMALFLPLPLFSQSYTNEDIQLKDSLTSGFSKSEWTVKQMIVPLSLFLPESKAEAVFQKKSRQEQGYSYRISLLQRTTRRNFNIKTI